MFTLGEPVTFLRAGDRADPYSATMVADDWTLPTTALVTSCGVQPVDSDELTDARAGVVTRFRLYLAGLVDVDPAWRCQVRGHVCQVVGEPARWTHPATGWEAGTVVEVVVVDG